MRLSLIGPGLCIIALLGLSACVPTTTASTASAPAAPAVAPAEEAYLSTSDRGFTVPAVPVEKIPPQFRRQVVDFETTEAPGTIIVDPSSKFLYFVTGKNKAIRYGVSVGRAGFEWHGVADVTNRRAWPTWTPPPEMIDRDPKLAKWANGQPGGPSNPLGARALYLTTNGRDYGYRIHGTPDWWSIGKNASSGCIRMIHQDVIDLYERVPDGAKVIVLTRDGQMPSGLKLPPPQPAAPLMQGTTPAQPAAAVTPQSLTTPTLPAAPILPGASAPAVVVPNAPVSGASTTGPSATVTPTPAAPLAGAAPVVTPVVTPAPVAPAITPSAVAPAAAPVTTAPAPAACPVPLINGTCPQN
ncbi:MAG: L,D-transpeptidase family protein [Cypionkella sp.]|nr:L,D-transpeptidase family protein [Cypionkella sp.]